jgi:hypothetical protein
VGVGEMWGNLVSVTIHGIRKLYSFHGFLSFFLLFIVLFVVPAFA